MKTLPKLFLPFCAALLIAADAPSHTEKFIIDPSDTYIGFTARHLMVTNVKGKFKSFSGEVDVDEQDITRSTARITIETASLSTDNEKRDHHLKSDDFLNVARYPQISFVGKSVRRVGEQLELIGDLTIRDVTRAVAIPFQMIGPTRIGGHKQIGVEATLTINRFDYGLKYNKFAEAVQIVAPDVKIELAVAANTAGE